MAKLIFFGNIVDTLDAASEHLYLSNDIRTVEELLKYLRNRGDQWEYVFSGKGGNIQITVNKEFADMKHRISNVDEIAFVSMGE